MLQVGLPFLLISFSLFLVQPIQAQTISAVSGLVFEDLNLNNTLDYGEKPLLGWQVDLYQNDKLIQTQLTDSLGSYHFTGLTSGNYSLKLAVPDTWAPVVAKNVLFNLRVGENFKANFATYQVISEKIEFGPMMVISNINVKLISPTAAEISWFTTHLATTQIVRSEKSIPNDKLILNNKLGYPTTSEIDFSGVTYHKLVLSNLKPATTYYYRVVSLADPKQWRGALVLFSPELSFTTSDLPTQKLVQEEQKKDVEEQNKEATSPEKTKLLGKEGALSLGTEKKELKVTEVTSTVDLNIKGEPEKIEKNASTGLATADCHSYILFLSILNLIAIIFIWQKNKESNRINHQRLWWLILIMVLVPTILGYPQCWLIVWLGFILILSLVCLFGNKGKKEPPDKFFGPKGVGTDLFFEPKVQENKSANEVKPIEKENSNPS